MFTVLAALSEMEREYIRDRTLEGHESARSCGKHIGAVVTDDAMLSMALHLREQNLSLRDIAARLVITKGKKKGRHPSPATVLRMLREHDEANVAGTIDAYVHGLTSQSSTANGGPPSFPPPLSASRANGEPVGASAKIRSDPPRRPLVAGLPGAVAGDVPPGRSGAQPPRDAADDLAVVAPGASPAVRRGQQGLDPLPGLVGQLTSSHHEGSSNRTRGDH
ncbi:hypothetical protein [Streptosporangium carneum]|uniref:hypothetical protein n=1 Tax=Streptosporangium carneum TaxID=47481 RepID=UPI003CD05333